MDQPDRISTAELEEMIVRIHQGLAELRASVKVLKVFEAMRLNPTDPSKGFEALARLESRYSDLDPLHQQIKQAAELMDALKTASKLGGSHDA